VRLVRSAFAARELTLEAAIALVEYHVRRNKAAKVSHDKEARHNNLSIYLLGVIV
jgi:hypothetical protein